MLKSEDHVYVEDLNLSRNKFKYLIKSGKIIARKFDFHDRYVCIFETTSDKYIIKLTRHSAYYIY